MTTSSGDNESYGDYSVDDEDQPGNIDDLGDEDVADELDRGYSPPEHYSAGQGYGNTPWEEEHRESIDQRRRQEIPDVDPYAEDDDADESDGDAEDEVGTRRSGRLVAPDHGSGEDTEKDMVAQDIGIDGAAASAEEAAMHIIEDDEDQD